MSEQEKNMKSITVLLAGRPYPLRINAGDEPAIRKIVKEVNEKVNRFQLTYSNKDKQDSLAMAVLTYAVELHKIQQSGSQHPSLNTRLTQLEDLLEQVLS
jgi:cell division protein ZapA (FtsZ GTPase activity inhibitor)